jgi:hypothetical protein
LRRRRAPSPATLGVPECERLARRIEAVELLGHLVDLIPDPEGRVAQTKPIRGEAVQMVKDANVGVHRGGLAGVDLAAEEVERPLEPRNLQKRVVVGRIGVASLKLLTNDLLHPTDAEPLHCGDGADRLPADQASENAPGALVGFGG